MTDDRVHAATAPHEVRGNLIFTQYQDRPYWAFRKLVHDLDGGYSGTVEVLGEEWDVSLGYDVSGVAPRPDDSVDKLYEYTLSAQGTGRRTLSARLQPRFEAENMTKFDTDTEQPVLDENDARVQIQGVPADLGRGVNWRVNPAVNLEPEEITAVLPRLIKAVTNEANVRWDPDYFAGTPHPYSNIWEYERYVRLSRDAGSKLVRSDGTFNRIRELLADERGAKMNISIDNTGKNQEVVGYNHQYRLNETAARKLLPGSQHGKQLKHYHPEYVQSDEEDPLYHPKFGVLFKKSWSDSSISWGEHRSMRRELEETLLNVLSWSDIPTKAGAPTFVADDHFDNTVSDVNVTWYDDPTPEIEANQESLFVSKFREMTDSDEAVLDQLLADGGTAHYEDIADGSARSISTVYRALDHLSGVLKSENGTVSFISEHIRQQFEAVFERAESAVSSAARAAGRVLDMDPRHIEEQGSAWQRWLNEYAVEVTETSADQRKLKVHTVCDRFRMTSPEFLPEVLDYGRLCWRKAGMDSVMPFDDLVVEFDTGSGWDQTRAGAALSELG